MCGGLLGEWNDRWIEVRERGSRRMMGGGSVWTIIILLAHRIL